MVKKNWIIIVLAVVVFLSAALLGVTTVYRIDGVTLETDVYSTEAQQEAEDLQEKLSALYKGENILFANDDAAKEVFEDYPYFRMTEFKKEFPNKIVIEAKEDVETYAVRGSDGYYILALDGTILGVRDNYTNRSDGNPNVLISGTALGVSGKKGEKISGDICWESLIKTGEKIATTMDGVRNNLVEISVAKPASNSAEYIFKFKTRETVNLYIRNPLSATEEKAKKLIEFYRDMEDEQRLCGMAVAFDTAEGVKVEYFSNDTLELYF